MRCADRLPRTRMDGLVVRELDDETLVYDMERDRAHCLNHTAALVWKQCDGKTTVEKAALAMREQLGISVDVDIVWLAIRQLRDFHLLENDQDRIAYPPPVSRRELLLKYAPAALALPVIMTISVPTPAQAGSCAQINQSCVNLPCCPNLFCFGSPPVCGPG